MYICLYGFMFASMYVCSTGTDERDTSWVRHNKTTITSHGSVVFITSSILHQELVLQRVYEPMMEFTCICIPIWCLWSSKVRDPHVSRQLNWWLCAKFRPDLVIVFYLRSRWIYGTTCVCWHKSLCDWTSQCQVTAKDYSSVSISSWIGGPEDNFTKRYLSFHLLRVAWKLLIKNVHSNCQGATDFS